MNLNLESLKNNLSSGWNSFTGSLTKIKNSFTNPNTSTMAAGGRRRKGSRRKRTRRNKSHGGNFHAYSPPLNASPISGIQTAKAHYVGGKRRRHRRRSRR